MSETRFTKGPWRTYETRGFQQRPVWEIAGVHRDSPQIAEVNNSMTSAFEAEEIEANAHLISSAPRMYWALNDIRDFLKRSGYDITLVDGVIKEARGESNA